MDQKTNDALSLYRSRRKAERERSEAALSKAVAAVLPKQPAAAGDKPPIPPPGGDKTNPDPDAEKSAPTGKKHG